MDTSLFSDSDSLPTFQEGDILTCFEEKSQIMEHFEKELDNSYSHRLLSFLKNDKGSNSSGRSSFLEEDTYQRERESQEKKKKQKMIHLYNQSQTGSEGIEKQQQNQQMQQLKRQIEKKSLAIPLSLQQQQQLQMQQSQRNYDKFDRPPLSQRVDTRSNLMNATISQNKDINKYNNVQSQQTLHIREQQKQQQEDNDEEEEESQIYFNPFQKNIQPFKSNERTSHSLRNSREGKLSTENIKNFYLDIQKQMKNQNDVNQDKENQNPNIKQDADLGQMRSIEIGDIKLQKSNDNLNTRDRVKDIHKKPIFQQQQQNRKEIEEIAKQNNKSEYRMIDEDQSNQQRKMTKLNEKRVETKVIDQCKETLERRRLNVKQIDQNDQQEDQSVLPEEVKKTEQVEILQIVTKIRTIKMQIDDVNRIVNLKKKELDSFIKASSYTKASAETQKSKEDDLNVVKKLAASNIFLNNKYDEMVDNYQEYVQKKERQMMIMGQNQSCGVDSTQDVNACYETNSFSKFQAQNFLSQNTTQINNISQSQIQSNSKNLNSINHQSQQQQQQQQYTTLTQSSSLSHNKNNNNHNNKLNNYSSNSSNSIERSKSNKQTFSHQLSIQSNRISSSISSARYPYQNNPSSYQFEEDCTESILPDQKQNNCYGQYSSRQLNKNECGISSRERLKTNMNNQSDESNLQIDQTLCQQLSSQTHSQNQQYSQNQFQSQHQTSSQQKPQNQFIRAKSSDQMSQMSNNKENSLFNEQQVQQQAQQQVQQQQQQVSSQSMIQNLISKLSLNKYTNKLNTLLQNHPSNQSSSNKEPRTMSQQKSNIDLQQQSKQIAILPQKIINQQLLSVPSQSSIKLGKNSSCQQIDYQNEQKAKQARSYSYQEKYAIQKQINTLQQQQKIQQIQ